MGKFDREAGIVVFGQVQGVDPADARRSIDVTLIVFALER